METLRYVVLANGLLAVVSIAYYVLLRRETFFGANRLELWLGLAASASLPLLELPDWRPQPVRTAMQRTAQAVVPKLLPTKPAPDVTITFPNQRTYKADLTPPAPNAWPWQRVVLWGYVAVTLVLLSRFGIQLWSLRRLIDRSVQEDYDDFTLVRSEAVSSPFSFFRYVVLNPDQHTPDELEQILRHERVHVRARHSLDMIAAELLCIICWFNPAAYLFRYLLQQTLEFQADRAVLAEGVDARTYQYNLLKVSLSAGPSNLTNSFSKSFLKPRIAMINRPNSRNATWLKYLVLVLATLTVATLFARPKVQTLAKVLPRPAARVVAEVTGPEQTPMPIIMTSSPETPANATSIRSQNITAETVQPPAAVGPDSVRKSPSRYMQYVGDRLYWIITPKTSFDDLAAMKQEFARHGYNMKIQTLKYDPLNTYINEIDVTIVRPTAGTSSFDEVGVEGRPIRSHGGYNGLNKIRNVAAVGSYPFDEKFVQLPQKLLQLLHDDEAATTTFIRANRLKYLIATGQKISSKYAPSSSTYNIRGMLAQPGLPEKYGFILTADSTFDVSDANLPLFINNEPVSPAILKQIQIRKFNTIISSENYGKNGQPGTIRALLFYTNEPQ